MIIVRHRINDSLTLGRIRPNYGVEIDLRLHMGEIVLAHDPRANGEKFSDWLTNYRHKLLILNVKEDGLEQEIIEIVRKKGIENYFFLDQPFPTLRKSVAAGYKVAVRTSEFESLFISPEFLPQWIWVDSFKGEWNHLADAAAVSRNDNVKICLVSPELQGREPEPEIMRIRRYIQTNKLTIDAVCTKNPEFWNA